MDEPILTIEERTAINCGRWFSSLSPWLRHDILRCAYVKRYTDGDLICACGDPATEWIACARGAVRVSSTSLSGKQITLTYIEPGGLVVPSWETLLRIAEVEADTKIAGGA